MAWYDNAWDHRREVTVDNTGGSAKTNYQVEITLTSANFDFTEALSTGADVRITDADETTLIDHWIEAWDSVGETATVWAEVPSIPGSSSKSIYLYYGNLGAADASNIDTTFLWGADLTDATPLQGSVDDDGNKATFNHGHTRNPLVQTSDITSATEIREQDSIVHDPNDPNLGTNPEREYKLYFSAIVSGNKRVYVLFSADASSWSSPQLCTFDTSNPRNYEDPSVCTLLNTPGQVYRTGSDVMYLYVEDGTDTIYGYSSTDGINWTALSGNPVIPKGAGGSWEETLVGSPVAVFDGTNFILGYEGISGSNEKFGTADGTAANSLTKNSNNPLLSTADHTDLSGTSVVIDAMFKTDAGTKIKLLGHDGLSSGDTIFGFETSETDPTVWANSDFSQDGTKKYDPAIHTNPTVNFANKSQIVVCPGNTAVYVWDVSTQSSKLFLERLNLEAGQTPSSVTVESGQATITPKNPLSSTDISLGLVATSDIGVASDFEIIARAKQTVNGAGDDNRSGLGFGSGAWGGSSGGDHRPALASGYQALYLTPGSSTGFRIGEYNASRTETLDSGTTLSATEANNLRNRTLSYRSTGALAAAVGTSTNSGTDTTFVTGNKSVYYYQGNRNTTDDGGITTIEWIVVRKYDGADTSQSVGTQEDAAATVSLYATADGTLTTLVDEADLTTSIYTSIDDDPASPTDSDWINNSIGTGTGFFDLTNMPGTFATANSATIVARYRGQNFGSGTVTLYAQLFQSDETTSLSNEVQVAQVTGNGSFADTSAVTITGINTSANKAVWDGARVRFRWATT